MQHCATVFLHTYKYNIGNIQTDEMPSTTSQSTPAAYLHRFDPDAGSCNTPPAPVLAFVIASVADAEIFFLLTNSRPPESLLKRRNSVLR